MLKYLLPLFLFGCSAHLPPLPPKPTISKYSVYKRGVIELTTDEGQTVPGYVLVTEPKSWADFIMSVKKLDVWAEEAQKRCK